MRTSEQTNELAKAMSLAQGQMKPAKKDSINPHFKSNYSDINSVIACTKEPLANNGLTVWQDVTTSEAGVGVLTRISHSSGQWVEFGPLVVPLSKRDAHGIGSATSYAKRYALCAALGVASVDDDDDGQVAVQKSNGGQANHQETPSVKITKDQEKEIREVLSKCSEEYQKKVTGFMIANRIAGLQDLPLDAYNKMLPIALGERIKHQGNLAKETPGDAQ